MIKEYIQEREKKLIEEFADIKPSHRNSIIKAVALWEIKDFQTQTIIGLLEKMRERFENVIKEELSAKPANELEKTAEWYKCSALQDQISYLDDQSKALKANQNQ